MLKRPLRPRWSIAARLTAWYAISSFALLAIASGFLYWALFRQLDLEDDIFLAKETQFISSLFIQNISDPFRIQAEFESSKLLRTRFQVYYRVLDSGDQVILQVPNPASDVPWPSRTFGKTTSPVSESEEARSPSGKFFEILTTSFAPASSPARSFWIQVAMDRTEEEVLLRKYRERLGAVLALLLAVCSLIGHWIARNGIKPIHGIIRKAQDIRSTTLHERIQKTELPSELLSLANTFNEMLDRLEASFSQISRFSQDLAHELRTPINNLLGEVEVTLGRSRSASEYREVLESSLEEYSKLAHMVESLLFLAQAENYREAVDAECLDLRHELTSIREFFEASALEEGIELRVDPSVDGLLFAADRTLFQRAVTNLLSNSLSHTNPGGSVLMSATSSAELVELRISDTGCGISSEHLPFVFDRLYRVDRSRTSSAGNLGLGLSLVKSIVELHGGSAWIESVVGQGTTVSLTFPRILSNPMLTSVRS